MAAWLSEQFKESLAEAVRASAKSYANFLKYMEKDLDGLVGLIKDGEVKDKKQVVKRLCSIMQFASKGKQEK